MHETDPRHHRVTSRVTRSHTNCHMHLHSLTLTHTINTQSTQQLRPVLSATSSAMAAARMARALNKKQQKQPKSYHIPRSQLFAHSITQVMEGKTNLASHPSLCLMKG